MTRGTSVYIPPAVRLVGSLDGVTGDGQANGKGTPIYFDGNAYHSSEGSK